VGGVSAIGLRRPSDRATAVLARIALTAAACSDPPEGDRFSCMDKEVAPFESGVLASGEDSIGFLLENEDFRCSVAIYFCP